MAEIKWSDVGEKRFETGIDRGVLYVDGYDGVPWNGLVSVNETPVGGDTTPYYLDGHKLLTHHMAEEFAGSIESLTLPREFAACEGSELTGHGLYITKQPKKTFGLSYRTIVGNDVDGVDYGYKLHLVYNAVLDPVERQYTTIGETTEPSVFVSSLTTTPKIFPWLKKLVSYVVIDSIGMNEVEGLEGELEDILYGTETTPPRLPEFLELYEMFSWQVHV